MNTSTNSLLSLVKTWKFYLQSRFDNLPLFAHRLKMTVSVHIYRGAKDQL